MARFDALDLASGQRQAGLVVVLEGIIISGSFVPGNVFHTLYYRKNGFISQLLRIKTIQQKRCFVQSPHGSESINFWKAEKDKTKKESSLFGFFGLKLGA